MLRFLMKSLTIYLHADGSTNLTAAWQTREELLTDGTVESRTVVEFASGKGHA